MGETLGAQMKDGLHKDLDLEGVVGGLRILVLPQKWVGQLCQSLKHLSTCSLGTYHRLQPLCSVQAWDVCWGQEGNVEGW